MKKTGNRFFTNSIQNDNDIFLNTVSSSSLQSIITDAYFRFFNSEQSFFIKKNIYNFNLYLNTRILLLSVSDLLEKNKINHYYNIYNQSPIINIKEFKFAILDSGFNNNIALIDINFLKNNMDLFNCDYFIFTKLTNPNFNLINMNTAPHKLKDINYIKDTILNKNISVSIVGFLERSDLSKLLDNENIIPSKTILDNKTSLANPSYYIYYNELKRVNTLLDMFNIPSEEIISETENTINSIDSKDINLNMSTSYNTNVSTEELCMDENYSFLKNFFCYTKKK